MFVAHLNSARKLPLSETYRYSIMRTSSDTQCFIKQRTTSLRCSGQMTPSMNESSFPLFKIAH